MPIFDPKRGNSRNESNRQNIRVWAVIKSTFGSEAAIQLNIKFQRKGVRDNLGTWRFDTIL